MWFGLVIGFVEHLQIVTTSIIALLLIHTVCSSLQHVLSFLTVLCLHQCSQLPFSRSQPTAYSSDCPSALTVLCLHKCSQLPCSRSQPTPLTAQVLSLCCVFTSVLSFRAHVHNLLLWLSKCSHCAVSSPVFSASVLMFTTYSSDCPSALTVLCLHQCSLLPCSHSQPTAYSSDCHLKTPLTLQPPQTNLLISTELSRADSLYSLTGQPKSKLYYDWRSAGQSVLVSDTHLGPASSLSPSVLNFFFFYTVTGLLMWGALSDEKLGL
jgi:hypothetical protein